MHNKLLPRNFHTQKSCVPTAAWTSSPGGIYPQSASLSPHDAGSFVWLVRSLCLSLETIFSCYRMESFIDTHMERKRENSNHHRYVLAMMQPLCLFCIQATHTCTGWAPRRSGNPQQRAPVPEGDVATLSKAHSGKSCASGVSSTALMPPWISALP